MLRYLTSSAFFVAASVLQAQTIVQSSTGDCSPNIGTAGGNVFISCNLGPTESQKISNAASDFFNDYLKFLSFSFSVTEDDAGYTHEVPRLPDGSVDLEKIKSAPAYGITKTSVAQYLYGRDEVSFQYAARIDEMITEAAREGEPLPFDAVIFAQDIPQSVLVGEPTYVSENHAAICVWTFSQKEKKCDLVASLRKEGSNWKIYDIQSNGTLSWLHTPKQFICNHDSELTNVRAGPSAQAFDIVSALPNGWLVNVIDDAISPNSPVENGRRIPFYYFHVAFKDPQNGRQRQGFVYDQAVYVVCTKK